MKKKWIKVIIKINNCKCCKGMGMSKWVKRVNVIMIGLRDSN